MRPHLSGLNIFRQGVGAMSSKMKKALTPYFFLAPHLIIFSVFFVMPLIIGFYVSFTKWNLYGAPNWVGFGNYNSILLNNESTFFRQFWNGLGNTFKFVLMIVPFQILIPLAIAIGLASKPFMGRLFQGIFYVPTLFSISSVILVWFFMLHPTFGLMNHISGIYVNWFGKQPFAWISVVVVTIWWIVGQNMVIYVAALSGIDKSILESAEIDGASGIKKVLYIYLPLIKFPLLFTIVAATTSQFNIYGQPLMLTQGGPTESTYVLIMYIRDLAFGSGKSIAGMASAMSTILGLIIGVFAVFQMLLLLRQDTDN